MQAFKYQIKHIKDATHLVPDALSRLLFDDDLNPVSDRLSTCRPARDPDGDDKTEEEPRGSLDETYASRLKLDTEDLLIWPGPAGKGALAFSGPAATARLKFVPLFVNGLKLSLTFCTQTSTFTHTHFPVHACSHTKLAFDKISSLFIWGLFPGVPMVT